MNSFSRRIPYALRKCFTCYVYKDPHCCIQKNQLGTNKTMVYSDNNYCALTDLERVSVFPSYPFIPSVNILCSRTIWYFADEVCACARVGVLASVPVKVASSGAWPSHAMTSRARPWPHPLPPQPHTADANIFRVTCSVTQSTFHFAKFCWVPGDTKTNSFAFAAIWTNINNVSMDGSPS